MILENYKNILNKTNEVHKYWIKWSEKFTDIEYKLYKLHRERLINYNENWSSIKSMHKRISHAVRSKVGHSYFD